MADKVFKQIMSIRYSGAVNMLSLNEVQRLAYKKGYYELICYIEAHRREYWRFIMTGEAES